MVALTEENANQVYQNACYFLGFPRKSGCSEIRFVAVHTRSPVQRYSIGALSFDLSCFTNSRSFGDKSRGKLRCVLGRHRVVAFTTGQAMSLVLPITRYGDPKDASFSPCTNLRGIGSFVAADRSIRLQ